VTQHKAEIDHRYEGDNRTDRGYQVEQMGRHLTSVLGAMLGNDSGSHRILRRPDAA
jgi:hypothetical protein